GQAARVGREIEQRDIEQRHPRPHLEGLHEPRHRRLGALERNLECRAQREVDGGQRVIVVKPELIELELWHVRPPFRKSTFPPPRTRGRPHARAAPSNAPKSRTAEGAPRSWAPTETA